MSSQARKLASAQGLSLALLATVWFQPLLAEQVGAVDCNADRTEFHQDNLLECFDQSLSNDPRFQQNLPIIAPYWQAFGPQAKEATFERFRLGYTASEAIAAGVTPRTAPVMRVLHAQAIELAEREFLWNMSKDPQLEGLSQGDFEAYRDEILNAFLDGSDNSALIEFVTYAPAFTDYVLTFSEDFVFAEDLQRVANIAEQNAIQAEQNAIQAEVRANIAEQNVILEALKRLQIALQGGLD